MATEWSDSGSGYGGSVRPFWPCNKAPLREGLSWQRVCDRAKWSSIYGRNGEENVDEDLKG